jgi:hypothetical protein
MRVDSKAPSVTESSIAPAMKRRSRGIGPLRPPPPKLCRVVGRVYTELVCHEYLTQRSSSGIVGFLPYMRMPMR